METNQDIKKLLKECLARNKQAQRKLYNLYATPMYRAVYRITNHHHDAEDVLQLAFIKVFNKVETYNADHGTVFNWMYRIAINEAISHIRKMKIHFLEIDKSCFKRIAKNSINTPAVKKRTEPKKNGGNSVTATLLNI